MTLWSNILVLFGCIAFILGKLPYFKAQQFFPAVQLDICLLLFTNSWKKKKPNKHGGVYQFCIALALKELGHAFCYVFKRLKLFSHQLNCKNDGLILQLKTIFRHWNCFPLPIATDDMDGHRLKREKGGPTFSSFNAMPAKIIRKIIQLVFPDGICLMSSSLLYRSILL